MTITENIVFTWEKGL